MKTFTNLIKRASFSTFNMKRYYLFIIMLLTLGIGTAWAESIYFEGFEENHRTSGSNSYSADAKTYGDWTLMYADAATTGSPLTGTAHVIMRVAKNTTNSPSLISSALLSNTYNVTKVSWNSKGNAAQTLKVSYSTDGSTWTEKYSAALKTSKTANNFTLDNVPGPIYLKFVVSVTSSTSSYRDANIDDITIEGIENSSSDPDEPVTPEPTPVTVTLDQTTLSLQEGENATLTATVTGSSDPVTWTSSEPTVATVNEGVVTALTAGETTITAAIGEVKATCVVTVTAAPVTPDPGAGSANVTYDFTKIDGFSSWGNSYAEHIVTYSDAKVTFEAASKQTSNVTDCPVTKGKYVTLVMTDGSTLSSVEWVCKQWTTKTQTITLHYSTDGGNTYTSTGVTSTNFTISSNNLPVGTNAVKITFSSTNNQVGISSCTITKVTSDEPQPVIVKTLKSIAVTPATTTYEQGDVFSFDGTCTATYSVTKDGVAQEDETKEVTPTSVSTPDMSTTGDKVVTVSYTEGEVTVKTTYTITVTENTITPGTHPGNLNNAFFGCETGNNAEEQSGKLEDILVVSGCTQSATTKTNYQSDHVRYYADNYLIFSAPTGYVLTAIQFTAYTTSEKWDGEITATVGTYDADGKSWTGSAQEVQFNFGKQNRIASVSVTYAEASKYALTITTPSNGTLTVKEGENAVATGDKFFAGTQLTVTATPEEGYKLASVSVVDGSSNDVTASVYDNGTLTMPEYDVTVSATFSSIKELDKIEVNTTDVKKTFWQGEAFSSNGLEVTAYYTDGTSAEVTPTNITGGNTANAGEITVTVSYTEGSNTKTTTYNITVKAIENNETTVYTVAQAREIIDAVGSTTVEVYVQGIVNKIVTAFNPTYGNISYDISADGLKTSDQLQAYRGFSYDGAWFTSANDIQVGDVVVVKGKLKIYNTTYELDEGNQLVSLVRSTEPKPTAATLPFEFDNGKADIEKTPGMSQNGLGSDYGSAPLLKFDGTGDYVIIHFNGEPGKLSYDIKGNSYSDGTFTVQESEDGSAYTNIVEYTELGSTETKTHTLAATSRYVKFIYTEKVNGNVALGNIKIALPGEDGGEDPEEPGEGGEGGGETPVVPTINPTATFIFNTAEGLNDLGITYPATADKDTEGAFKTEFENNATFTQDGITMTTTGGTTAATRVWLTKNGALDLRVYKGATLTFSVPAEHKISAIVLDGSNIGHLLVNGTAVSGNAWTGSKQTVTFAAKADASTIRINTIAFVVEYTRDVTNTYGTICLPYASASTTGAYFYEVAGKEDGKVYLASVDALAAGVPYIFEATAGTITVTYQGKAVDAPQNDEANGLVGTFVEIEVPNGDYILYGDKFCTNNDSSKPNNKIRANRAYLDMDAVKDGKPTQMPGRRYIGMDVEGENEATGLDNIQLPNANSQKLIINGQLIIIRDGEMYNAQGVRF